MVRIKDVIYGCWVRLNKEIIFINNLYSLDIKQEESQEKVWRLQIVKMIV